MPIRVIIADDHPIVLDGLAQLFAAADDIEVVTRCANGDETLSAVRRAKPDVVVLEMRLPGRNGLDVLRALQDERHSARAVLFTSQLNDAELHEAVRLGVAGIILKEKAARLLLQCVRQVAAGGQCLDPSAQMTPLRNQPHQTTLQLTRRELDIVRMAASGARNREIGERLGISEGTVKMHLHSIYGKLRVSGRVELTIYAREHALV